MTVMDGRTRCGAGARIFSGVGSGTVRIGYGV